MPLDYQIEGAETKIDLTQTTFDGRAIKVSEMTQQHLSNCIWYSRLVYPMWTVHHAYMDELNKRFEGKVLGYYPNPNFTQEFYQLLDGRYLDGIEPDVFNIKYRGEVIGMAFASIDVKIRYEEKKRHESETLKFLKPCS